MSPTAIILVLISALMHAGWNLLSKSKSPSAAFFLIASVTGSVFFSPVLLLYHHTLVHHIPPQVWLILLISTFFLALYYISLAGAYRAGDMSVAYPLARSSPIIVVTVATLILGRSNQITQQCVVGISLVVGGCFMVPLERFGDIRIRNYLNVSCGLAMVAAFATAGYSMLDDAAIRILKNMPGLTLSTLQISLLYICLVALMTSLWLIVFIAIMRKERSRLRHVLQTNKINAILTGLILHNAYVLVLLSLPLVKNVSYVVAFRQLSIPLGTMLAVIILKEAPHIPKLIGVITMFIGLVLVAIG